MKLRDVIEAHKYSKADGRDYDRERKYNKSKTGYRAKLNKYKVDAQAALDEVCKDGYVAKNVY